MNLSFIYFLLVSSQTMRYGVEQTHLREAFIMEEMSQKCYKLVAKFRATRSVLDKKKTKKKAHSD
jgi:hypothetical protein